jgi:hypothetical protein
MVGPLPLPGCVEALEVFIIETEGGKGKGMSTMKKKTRKTPSRQREGGEREHHRRRRR